MLENTGNDRDLLRAVKQIAAAAEDAAAEAKKQTKVLSRLARLVHCPADCPCRGTVTDEGRAALLAAAADDEINEASLGERPAFLGTDLP